MEEEKRFTEAEAHRRFAIQFHGKTWDLLDKIERTADEDELMVHTAHASLRHWLEVGTGLHHQCGEWLVARVYTVLNRPHEAERHARRCLDLTQANADLMADFDWAFAYEAMARASAAAGRQAEALHYLELAEKAGQAIADEGDRKVFLSELHGGHWHGVRREGVART
jgi:tetratricopeptide (TPR) repeat protein